MWNDLKRFETTLLEEAFPPALEELLVRGQLPHCLGLEGGSPERRERMAFALAGAILCQEQQGHMCGTCTQCQKVMLGVHSDIFLADGIEESFKKKNIRAMRAEAFRKPSEGRAKVYVLAEAQGLDPEVQNLLLKVIEEPPEATFFIFTCDNRYRLLPTILSRMVTVTLQPPDPQEVLCVLREYLPDRSEEELRQVLALAEGELDFAKALLTDSMLAKRYTAARQVAQALGRGDACEVLTTLAPWEKKREEYAALLEMISQMVTNPQLRKVLSLSDTRGGYLGQEVQRLREHCEVNGYLPLLSALLAEAGKSCNGIK